MSAIKTESSGNITTTTSATVTPYGGVYQLPVNMSSHPTNASSSSSSSTTTTSTTTTTRNNISVTNIKCEVDDVATPNGNIVPVIASTGSGMGYYNGVLGATMSGMGMGVGIRIPVTKAEDSDSEAELTNIENLKVTRRATSSSGPSGNASNYNHNKTGPRPMSWEGELSETETTETELMETESSLSNADVGVVAVIKSEATTTTPSTTSQHQPHQHHHQQQHLHHQQQHHHHQQQQHLQHHQQQQQQQTQQNIQPASSTLHRDRIKPELEQISVEIHHNSGGGAAMSNSIYATHQQHTKLKLAPTQSDPINLKYEPADATAVNSPLLARNKSTTLPLPTNPSPDSAIHSVYTHSSPSQSPLTSRHAPYTPSLSRNNSDASHSSCYSYSSEFSPTHSPIQGRHAAPPGSGPLYGSFNGSLHHPHSVLYRPISSAESGSNMAHSSVATAESAQNLSMDSQTSSQQQSASASLNISGADGLPASAAGISRQQLINSPCPICGDKISGFHYGIFSCESCKGFFKRTVQNRKNYVCVRGGPCPVSISTRKKCPACRFEKCLQKGMKLEAIREDRTRGGRSTYQCSYTLPNSMLSPLLSPDQQQSPSQQLQQQQRLGAAHNHVGSIGGHHHHHHQGMNGFHGGGGGVHVIKTEQCGEASASNGSASPLNGGSSATRAGNIPVLLQEIMDVEHLWQYNEAELTRLNQPLSASSSSSSSSTSASTTSGSTANHMTNPLLASAGLSSNGENANPDLIAHLCNVADHRLYKIVKWCKSLPLFKNISIDDQICLLINSWCELLLFSCCYRSIDTPGEIKMSQGKKINLAQAKSSGLQACIERMLNLTDHLRRLRIDRYEYVAMKVIVLLQSDTSELQEPVKVRECQEKALQSLQAYTLAHYPDAPSKFGELLLRIPDLQRTCQLGKEMLTIKSRDGGDFNLLMELLRGEH